MSLIGNISVGILGNMSGLSSTLNQVQKELGKFSKNMKFIGRDVTDAGKAMTLLVTGPLAAVGGGALKASIDFESAFAGVKKTVNATSEEIAGFRQGILDMSQKMPAAATDIAAVAEAAGQLGIHNDALLDFTKTMVDLGVSTNLTATQAASDLAKLANITQLPQDQFSNLGSTIVALGNNLATTEADIVSMGLRIAGAGHQIGLTEAQTLAFAGSLSSVGIEAEAGGSAVSRVMIGIANEVATGGKKLDEFAQVAGTTGDFFAAKFKTDAAGAIVDFIEGLNRMSTSGQNVFGVLDDLGLSEIRVRDALLRASGAGDLLRQSLDLSTQAWKDNTALTKEAEQRYATTASQLQIFKNRTTALGIELGDSLAPALLKALDAAKPLFDTLKQGADWFAGLSKSTQENIIVIAALAAALGPVVVTIGLTIQALSGLVIGIRAVSAALAFLAANPVVLIIAAIVALGVAIFEIIKHWDTVKEYLLKFWDWLKSFLGTWCGIILTVLLPFIGIPLQIAAHWDTVKTFFIGLWDWTKRFFAEWGTTILAIISPFIGVPILIAQHWDQVKTYFANLWNSVIGYFSNAWKKISDFVAKIKNAALSVVGLGGSTASSGATSSINAFASGTRNAPGGWSLVGEKGPELVNLPRGAQVKTAAETSAMMSPDVRVTLVMPDGRVLADVVSKAQYNTTRQRSRGLGVNPV